MLDIETPEPLDGTRVIRPVGELDAFTVMLFRASIAEIHGPERLVIDLSRVVFVDSAGLGALIGGIRRTRELGGQAVLASPRPTLTRLFHATGLDRIATVVASVDEAIEELRRDLCATGSESA